MTSGTGFASPAETAAPSREGVDLAVSERFAQFTVSLRFEDLPTEVVEHAKDLLVNQLAVAFAGRSTDLGKRAIDLAHQLSPGSGTSTILGERRRAAMLDAIFAHSILIGQDIDDATLSKPLHIGRVTHPIAWVLGERERVTGRELITAVVLGYDVPHRLAFPRLIRNYNRLSQNAFSPLAAAAVAARLLRLDTARTAHAIAYAAHLGMGLIEGAEVATTGLVARDGVMAALLAEPRTTGLRTIESPRGLFATVFNTEPEDLEAHLATLGREFAIMEASTKRYPSSASHILPLEFTKQLVDETSARADDVQSLVVTVSEDFQGRFAFRERIDRPDATETDATRSLQLKLALVLAYGEIVPAPGLAQRDDPVIRRLLPKIELRFEPGLRLDEARATLALAGGRNATREGTFRPYPKGDWSAWIRRDGERFLPERKLVELERLLTSLEDVDDIAAVMECVVPD